MTNQTYELLIMSLLNAGKYQPTKPTYVIRIASPPHERDLDEIPLQDSSLYIAKTRLLFDDLEVSDVEKFHMKGSPLSEQSARFLLLDFANKFPNIETVLIHCEQGEHRSPAIAMALNNIFNLGYDPEAMKTRYPNYTHWPYDILLKEAQELGLLSHFCTESTSQREQIL